mgnify:CR=1 FL=1
MAESASKTIAVIEGDGIGREVIPAAVRVLEALNLGFAFEKGEAGDATYEKTGEALPEETVALAKRADATLFGAAGDHAVEVVLPLRRALDTYVNVRPAKAYPGVDALHPETDLVFLRENTEGVYAGHESRLSEDLSTLTRVITTSASRRLAEFACDFVSERGSDGFTIAHKANVMVETDGRFVDGVESVAAERGVETERAIMDALAMNLVMFPEDYDVIVCPNLAGDLLSDLAAGLVGGLGLLPSANIGPESALFEPVHGTAPDIAGQGTANPSAAILSAAMLCEHLGYEEAAGRVRTAVETVLEDGPRTADLGGDASTDTVADAVINRL